MINKSLWHAARSCMDHLVMVAKCAMVGADDCRRM
jgi:hypothetical protein